MPAVLSIRRINESKAINAGARGRALLRSLAVRR
jgi:hypothetical protein